MCGRVVQASPSTRFAELLGASAAAGTVEHWRPRWNLAPTQQILGVYELELPGRDGRAPSRIRTLQAWRWGLLPPWVEDPKRAGATFNARAETAASRPAFREAFRRRRLAVPVDRFFEWRRHGKLKEPYAFARSSDGPLVLAGLWQPWQSPEGEIIQTATILTTAAGPDAEEIHDRQPVVLDNDEAWSLWLDPSIEDPAALAPLLAPSPAGTLERYRVGSEVNRTENDGPELINPLAGS